jgi:chromosome segregation ATPase
LGSVGRLMRERSTLIEQIRAPSPERAGRLSELIAERGKLAAELRDLDSAAERCSYSQTATAEQRADELRAAIETAREDRARDLVDGTSNARPIAELRAELAAAEDEIETLKLARQDVAARRRAAQMQLDDLPRMTRNAALAVMREELRDAPAIERLLDDLREARKRLLDLSNEVYWLARAEAISPPGDLASTAIFPPVHWQEPQPENRWADALDALCADPAAPLPD